MRLEFVGPPGVGKTTIMAACGKKKPRNLVLARVEKSEFTRLVKRSYVGVQRKHDGAAVTMRQLSRALAADQCEKWCWYSELLLQRGLSLALARRNEFDLVRRFFELVPMPALAVFVLAPEAVILERNRRRFLEEGKDDRSESVPYLCEVAQVALYRAKLRGTPLLVLDATRPVKENAARVLEAVG